MCENFVANTNPIDVGEAAITIQAIVRGKSARRTFEAMKTYEATLQLKACVWVGIGGCMQTYLYESVIARIQGSS